jgi:hypothetical protein
MESKVRDPLSGAILVGPAQIAHGKAGAYLDGKRKKKGIRGGIFSGHKGLGRYLGSSTKHCLVEREKKKKKKRNRVHV